MQHVDLNSNNFFFVEKMDLWKNMTITTEVLCRVIDEMKLESFLTAVESCVRQSQHFDINKDMQMNCKPCF